MQIPDPNSNRSKRKEQRKELKNSYVATRPLYGEDNVPTGTYYHPRVASCCKCSQEKIVWDSKAHDYREGVLYVKDPTCEECSK